MGYIICPIVIPANADPEQWLSTSEKEEGWQELGQILLALRAHDQRIEENLAELLHLHIPKAPEVVRTLIAIANSEDKRIQYREHLGPPGEAPEICGTSAGRKKHPGQGVSSSLRDARNDRIGSKQPTRRFRRQLSSIVIRPIPRGFG